ncbi:uncharacterized protein LOC131008086 [Salvia miltiorrhiza]|uniref:uncharacterized protein LOC131008086 n=1 Tax=Salvia miltiorrhiza TaxID=226208 RepID=UPI0025AD3166|nr:uncharacterized protein LOC131008086 [Salvia miltiorrhiza]
MVQQNQYGRKAVEDPNAHLAQFLELYSTVKINGVPDDIIRLHLFPFSLRDKAKSWYQTLQLGANPVWRDLVDLFLRKMFMDTVAGGSLLKNGSSEAMEIIESMATTCYQWPSERVQLKKAAAVSSSDPLTLFATQITELTSKINTLTTARSVGFVY